MKFRISRHASEEMQRRSISLEMIESVLNGPQQVVTDPEGKSVYQSKIDFPSGKAYLVRVIVAEEADTSVVVTVYRTGKVEKYWRKP